MIKVLQVVGQLSVGGQEMMAKNFFQYIDRTRFAFDYVVYGDEIGEYESQLMEMGARIFHVSKPSAKNIFKFCLQINKILRENQYDVVHSHTYTNSGIILFLANLNNIPIRVSHCHSTGSGKKETFINKRYEKFMKMLIKKCATCYIACGEKAGNSFYGEKLFQEQGIIIKNGIDTKRFDYDRLLSKELKTKMGLTGKVVIGHIGRFAEVKNHEYMIKIIKYLATKGLDFSFVFVGDGELLGSIKEKVLQQGLDKYCIFTGNRNDVPDLLQVMDVVVCPSLYEGLPVTAVEAQCNGLRCVVSKNVSEEVDLLNRVVFLGIEEDNVGAWGQTIVEIVQEERAKVRRGYSEELKALGFDIVQVCKELEIIYEK